MCVIQIPKASQDQIPWQTSCAIQVTTLWELLVLIVPRDTSRSHKDKNPAKPALRTQIRGIQLPHLMLQLERTISLLAHIRAIVRAISDTGAKLNRVKMECRRVNALLAPSEST